MRTVGALVFPGFEPLDLFGPLEMLGLLSDDFDLKLVADSSGALRSNPYVSVHADLTTDQSGTFDILLVPGGPGTRKEVDNEALLDWIADCAQTAEYVLSVCTGSALLARAGVLDGNRATTNKAAFAWVAEQGPRVHWVRQARWVEDGKFITSSGVSAGMDMTLAVIALLHGVEKAEHVATFAEYEWHRDQNWDPFARIHGLVE